MGFECYTCWRTLTTKQGLWRHKKIVHGPPEVLLCGRCCYQDKQRDNLKRHYRRCHTQYMEKYASIRPTLIEHPQSQSVEQTPVTLSLPVQIDCTKLAGRLARGSDQTTTASLPATVSKAPQSPTPSIRQGDAVITLSPTPISPLHAPSFPMAPLKGRKGLYLYRCGRTQKHAATQSPCHLLRA